MPKFIVISIMILFIFVSCFNTETDGKLTSSEELMEENPDSAMSILRSISGILNREDSARYALLMTYALFKQGEDIDSDSLINKAYFHYETTPTSKYWMMSSYYRGKIMLNAGNFSEAATFAMQAYDCAINGNNNLWKARTSQLLSEIFTKSHLHTEALKYSTQAAAFYLKAGKLRNHRFAICDMATDYSNLGDYDRAIHLNDSIFKIASNEPQDKWLQSNILLNTLGCFYYSKQYEKADSIFNLINNFDKSILTIDEYLKIADTKRKLNKTDEAIDIIKKCDSYIQDNNMLLLKSYLIKSNICRELNDYKNAMLYLDSMISSYNKEIMLTLQQPVTISQRNYFERLSDKKGNVISNYKTLMIFIVSFICLIILVGIWVYKFRMKIKNIELSRQLAEIEVLYSHNMRNQKTIKQFNDELANKTNMIDEMADTISEKNDTMEKLNVIINTLSNDKEDLRKNLLNVIREKSENISELTTLINRLKNSESELKTKVDCVFRKQWKTLNLLCEEYYEKTNSEKAKASILKTIENELLKMKEKKSIEKIENMVNEYMDNIIIKLRAQCKFLNEKDIQFIMLCYAGMSPRTVCFFTGVSLKNYYAKKTRLAERIIKSDAQDKDMLSQRLIDKAYK